MTTDELHFFLENNDPPFTIRTHGGRSYIVNDRANLWVPEPYEGLFCITVLGKGLIVVRQSSIESIQIEHAVSATR